MKSQVLNTLYLRVLFFVVLLPVASLAFAQNDSLNLSNTIDVFRKQPAQETVYLHLNKPNYGFGDTIWYKAYTVIGQKHQLSALSGVLHVELISPTDSLVSRQSIPLVSGIGWSNVPLSVKLKPGNYRLRAYTRWMRNFGADSFADQSVMIGGVTSTVVKSSAKCDVQFFPEGGQLVDGVRSRVAVKAVSSSGIGIDVKGIIEDNLGNVEADFSTQHLGMGVFALVPESGKNYRAKINIPGEATFTIDLPKAQPVGYALNINNSQKDSIYVKISTNEKTLSLGKDKYFYIIAQSNGKIYYTTQGKLDEIVYTAAIAKNRFPEGIAQFTLFGQNNEALAERIIFIQNKADELSLSVKTPIEIYATRAKTTLNLTANDSANKPVSGSFSVSVINENKVLPDENNESTILNNLLLTSELKGYIEQRNYYFTNQNDKTKSDLDMLMLTQGYRKYVWEQILNNPTDINYYPERTQELSGIITTSSGKVSANSKIILAATKQEILRDTAADENGKFTFTGLNIIDTATIVVRARKTNNGTNVKIKQIETSYPQINPVRYPDTWITTDTAKAKQYYTNYNNEQKEYLFKNGKMLKTVVIKSHKEKTNPDLQFSSNLNGPGQANQIIMYTELGPYANLEDCLTGKLRGVVFGQGKPLSIRHAYAPMRIILDGVLLSANASINDIGVDGVYSIEVLNSGAYLAIYGSTAGTGAIIITTKRGVPSVDPASIHPDGLIVINYMGFYKSKTFYSPRYDTKRNTLSLDNRSTIYWNPNILTDKDGKASLEFYNNDTRGTYRVIVEGIDDEGRLGRQMYKYEVK